MNDARIGFTKCCRAVVRAGLWAALAVALPMAAQDTQQTLNENCTVSILNRNAVVAPDGSWIVPNVPAGFGQVRARATCGAPDGTAKSGESTLFNVPANGGVDVPQITLGPATPIPQIITVT